jgi:hypothetical protein
VSGRAKHHVERKWSVNKKRHGCFGCGCLAHSAAFRCTF